MVKRGKRLSPNTTAGYISPKTKRLTQKKYMWICETCGAEYIYKMEAEMCEGIHLLEDLEKRNKK